ncbi:hypothetical protein WICPIJ_009142 [Wickerhamomyces pijperi]|uniref:Uncharacterized protein n=1 Tax=Wickerhamomyces pijperi TaxID=599730 RepID=A0A9P8PRM2_WICPI|nr:hypothetical protein WICPIJ_009142 [Wickerhamomyces pijperi]
MAKAKTKKEVVELSDSEDSDLEVESDFDRASDDDYDAAEDGKVAALLKQQQQRDKKKSKATAKQIKEFENLSYDFKLEKLQSLVQQSQIFSSIISDTLLESSLAKKKQREEQEKTKGESVKKEDPADLEPSKKRLKRSKDKEVIAMAKETKAKLENHNSTIKQPSLVTGGTMRDYQLEGTEWLITLYENGLNGILADEMGLGKTIQSIALLAFLYEQGINGNFLITAPLSTVGNWDKEFKRFAPNVTVLKYLGTKDERAELRRQFFNKNRVEQAVVITSYETVLRDIEYFNTIDWKFLIVDEGHRLKNMNCLLIRELKRLRTSNRLLLTGTPLQNNLSELWSLLNFILPDIFHDLDLFQKWFDFGSLTDISKGSQDTETKKLIESTIQESLVKNLHTILKPFLLRRLKRDVVKNLPPKREYLVYGKLTPMQSTLYKSALQRNMKESVLRFALNEHVRVNSLNITEAEVASFLKEKTSKSYYTTVSSMRPDKDEAFLRSAKHQMMTERRERLTDNERRLEIVWEEVSKAVQQKALQNLFMQLRLICNSPYLFYFPWDDEDSMSFEELLASSGKLQVVNQLVPRLLKENHKVLIFSQFTKTLDLVEDWCELSGYESSRLDGSTNQEDREEEISRFNTDPNVKIFLLSTRAGGLGLNLTQADSVILFDNDWNPQVDLQAMDRVHRIGQTKPVVIYRLVLANTVEQLILAKADSKRKLEKLVIQLGKFESLKRLMDTDTKMSFDGKSTQAKGGEERLAKELMALFEDDRFKKEGLENVESSLLTDAELDELTDRSMDAYNRDPSYFDKFEHLSIFETTVSGLGSE